MLESGGGRPHWWSLDYFFHFAHFSASEKEHYVKAYLSAAQLQTAFEYKRISGQCGIQRVPTSTNNVPLFLGPARIRCSPNCVSAFFAFRCRASEIAPSIRCRRSGYIGNGSGAALALDGQECTCT